MIVTVTIRVKVGVDVKVRAIELGKKPEDVIRAAITGEVYGVCDVIEITSKTILEEGEIMALPENVQCPICEGPMVSRKGQYGTFWGCKKYPECRGTRDSMGRSKADRDKEKEAEKHEICLSPELYLANSA